MKYRRLRARLRVILTVAVLLITIAAFTRYFMTHPEQIRQLRQLSPLLLVELFALYGLITVSLVFILAASLAIIRVHIKLTENFLLTAYSSIINFFGPLQSGPGVRLVYLKQKYKVSVKKFMFATFLYYGFFALFSGLFLTIRVLPWWQTAITLAIIGGLSFTLIKKKRRQAALTHINPVAVLYLALATLCQVLLVTVLYFVELQSINPDISFIQAMTYTGAANFALFVSLTPGAIGFRESFLLFSQRLHDIVPSEVLTASLIDRATNVAFLGLLFIVTLSLHARERFNNAKLEKEKAELAD